MKSQFPPGYDSLNGVIPSEPPPPYTLHHSHQGSNSGQLDTFVGPQQQPLPSYTIPHNTSTVRIPCHMHNQIHHTERRKGCYCYCCCCSCPFWFCCLIVVVILWIIVSVIPYSVKLF